ncbi:hypothetical protein D9613_004880 [Agrocybe pediades]|uniref:Uncharacterized protein n=1 Tax=Agrocybe pediades TaxID=84607 RepID=A0A8H4QYV1_9AGAR|nr:hypothetical protein D9613_004880 [Agrocybe pediades]KAF9555366.1 hypothetical protein CPC08DRAFT_135393 [Agrocybe pediades]
MPLSINGVEAWITLENKKQVQEFLPEIDEETGTATCWISGEPGEVFALRWRDSTSPASPYQRDLSGFATMDGYKLGGRMLQARSYAPSIFSRVATSPTSCVPLTFTDLPRTAGIGEDWVTLGAITLDVHVVEVGEANRLHEGFSSFYKIHESAPLASATPFSSTEVTSVGKIATFIFKYRPLDVLQYHRIAPSYVGLPSLSCIPGPKAGEKRSACYSDDDEDLMESPVSLYSSSGGSDSDSSQEYIVTRRATKRPLKATYYGPLLKRVKV